MDPDDAQAHFGLAVSLTGDNQEREALEEYKKACALDTHQPAWLAHLAASQAQVGDFDGAISNFQKSLALDPSNPGAEADLGAALFENGKAEEGLQHMQKAVDMAPDFADGHSYLGTALAKMGRMDEAVDQLKTAVELLPSSVEYHFNLGFVLRLRGDYTDAIAAFQKAVALSEGKDWKCLAALADVYDKTGHSPEAVQFINQALALAVQSHDDQLQQDLRGALVRYERNGTNQQPQ